jgi:hypothetical protein
MDKKIRFKDLSGWLKLAVIVGWVQFGLFCVGFIIGFMSVLLGN